LAPQKAFQRVIRLPAGLGDWTQLEPKRKDETAITVAPIKGVYFDRLPEPMVKQALEIHYRFAEKLVVQLSSKLKIKVELHAVRCLQASYVDFLRDCSHRVYQANLPAHDSQVNFYMDDVLASAMVNRALGGKGEAGPDPKLSAAEKSVMQQLLILMAEALVQSWQGALPKLSVTNEHTFANLQVDSTLAKEDTYAVFSMDIVIGEDTARVIRWGYSRALLYKLLADFETKKAAKSKNVRLSEKVMHLTRVPVRMELGVTSLTAFELKKLQVGDVVTLDTVISEPVKVRVADTLTLYGQPGVQDGRVGVQLLSANAIPFVYREQMGLSQKQQLVVDDAAIVAEAQKLQYESLIDDVDDEDKDEVPAESPPPEPAQPQTEASEADTQAVAKEIPAEPAAPAPPKKTDDDDDEDLADLFADEDLKWDEDADDDEEI
jgi:flagellar motor switch protein FliM